MAEPTEEVAAVERVERFAAPPDAVWEAITDPALLEEWFGPVEIDLTPGGAITRGDGGDRDENATIGVVETVDVGRRIGFVWLAPGSAGPSSVEIDLDDDVDGGSVLRVREVLIRPHWDARPAWFASSRAASNRCAGAGARA